MWYFLSGIIIGIFLWAAIHGLIEWWDEEKKNIISSAHWKTMREVEKEMSSQSFGWSVRNALLNLKNNFPEEFEKFLKDIGVK